MSTWKKELTAAEKVLREFNIKRGIFPGRQLVAPSFHRCIDTPDIGVEEDEGWVPSRRREGND